LKVNEPAPPPAFAKMTPSEKPKQEISSPLKLDNTERSIVTSSGSSTMTGEYVVVQPLLSSTSS